MAEPLREAVLLTLPSGDRRTLHGRRARIAAWLATANYLDDETWLFGSVELHWNAREKILKVKTARVENAGAA